MVRKVLILTDHRHLVRNLCKELTAAGYYVQTVADVEVKRVLTEIINKKVAVVLPVMKLTSENYLYTLQPLLEKMMQAGVPPIILKVGGRPIPLISTQPFIEGWNIEAVLQAIVKLG
jgi:DNA-binding response OmpR family regulator